MMLFLLNRAIVEVEAPELYLAKNWRRIGCGDPDRMMASDAVDFSIMVVNSHLNDGEELSGQTMMDIASLLITKTGANAALFTGTLEARLNVLDRVILENLLECLNLDAEAGNLWAVAA